RRAFPNTLPFGWKIQVRPLQQELPKRRASLPLSPAWPENARPTRRRQPGLGKTVSSTFSYRDTTIQGERFWSDCLTSVNAHLTVPRLCFAQVKLSRKPGGIQLQKSGFWSPALLAPGAITVDWVGAGRSLPVCGDWLLAGLWD